MKRNPDVLERLAPLSGAPSRGFEDLVKLRTKRQLTRKIGAIAVVTVLVATLLGIGIVTIGDGTKRPATPPDESNAPFAGMVIRYTGQISNGQSGSLVAQDPSTGETITLVDAASELLADDNIARAAVSADGRLVAFEGTFCPDRDGVGEGRLWVTNGTEEPRPLMPCADSGRSRAGGRLGVVAHRFAARGGRQSPGDAPALILVDPATDDRTDLGTPAGEVTSLAWSPDGTRIAYATVPTGSPDGTRKGSVYTVSVDGGEHALIAESIGYVPGGEEGSGIQWSPDGTRIAVLADSGPGFPRGTLYVMDPDGSDRRPLAEGVLIEHILGSPNIVWSPDGRSIAYATVSDAGDHLRIWSAPVDGSAPVLVFDATDEGGPTGRPSGLAGGPVWSPDGTRIAFRYSRPGPTRRGSSRTPTEPATCTRSTSSSP